MFWPKQMNDYIGHIRVVAAPKMVQMFLQRTQIE